MAFQDGGKLFLLNKRRNKEICRNEQNGNICFFDFLQYSFFPIFGDNPIMRSLIIPEIGAFAEVLFPKRKKRRFVIFIDPFRVFMGIADEDPHSLGLLTIFLSFIFTFPIYNLLNPKYP